MREIKNPFTSSSAGGRTLSAIQLPFFLLRPPSAYGVISTRGRRTGKRRRRCVRVVTWNGKACVVSIKGPATGWVRNALATPDAVELRLSGKTVRGRARKLRDNEERREAADAYCEGVYPFDYLTWLNWRKGWPSADRIRSLLRTWFDEGTPVIIDVRP
jgi:deazaflavin-dependent oxidoreductase (nitroreductase family)